MERMRRGILALALLLLLAAMVAGCGGGMTAEDAKEYVQAVLDASYKGDGYGWI